MPGCPLNISSFLLSEIIATEQCRSTLLSVIQLSAFPLAFFSQICTLITKFNICNSCFHLRSFYKGHCNMRETPGAYPQTHKLPSNPSTHTHTHIHTHTHTHTPTHSQREINTL